MIWERILKATRKGIENILTRSVYTKDDLETVYYDLYEFYIFNKPTMQDILDKKILKQVRKMRKS